MWVRHSESVLWSGVQAEAGAWEAEKQEEVPVGLSLGSRHGTGSLRTLLGLRSPTLGPLSLELKGLALDLPGAPEAQLRS